MLHDDVTIKQIKNVFLTCRRLSQCKWTLKSASSDLSNTKTFLRLRKRCVGLYVQNQRLIVLSLRGRFEVPVVKENLILQTNLGGSMQRRI